MKKKIWRRFVAPFLVMMNIAVVVVILVSAQSGSKEVVVKKDLSLIHISEPTRPY